MKNSFLYNLIYLYGIKIIVLLLGFLAGIILARYLGPDIFGVFNSLIIFPMMISSFAELGIRQAIVYFTGNGKYKDEDFLGNTVYMFLFTSIIGSILCVVLLLFAYENQYSIETYIMVALLIPPQVAISYSNGFLLGKQDIKTFGRVTFFPNAIKIVAIVFLVIVFNMELLGGILSLFLSTLIVAGLYSRSILNAQRVNFNFNPLIIKKLISHGALYSISLLIILLNYKVDIYLLKTLSTNIVVGQYSVSVSICDFLLQIPFAAGILLFSKSASVKRDNIYLNKVILLLKFSLLTFILLTLSFFFLANYFIPLVYGYNYSESIDSLKILLMSLNAIIIFKILSMDMAGMGKPHLSLIATVPGLIINIILNILWIPTYGGTGAAYATLISYVFITLAYIIIYTSYNKLSLKQFVTFSSSDIKLIKNIMFRKQSAEV